MSFLVDVAIFTCSWAHVLLAPFTKVEESFNLHATHDILLYGVGPSTISNYDHIINPGPVRRTFLGSLALAWLSTPCIQFANRLGYMSTKFDLQIMIRLVLATLNALSLCLIKRAVSRRFGRPTSLLFGILSISQFHVPFYMGRTLPNMFALFPVNIATYYLLNRGTNTRRPSSTSILRAVSILIYVAVIMRAEVAMLLGPLVLQTMILRHAGISDVLGTSIVAGLFAVGITIAVDSFFWQRGILWPEFDNILFNVIQGKSSDWGTSPAVTYVQKYLPSTLLSAYPLSAIGFLLDKRIRILLVPCFAFIALLSGLGHKEWRFIVYVVPMFNVGAARALRWMVGLRAPTPVRQLIFLLVTCCLASNFLTTLVLTRASMANYPGGEALQIANRLISQTQSDAFTLITPHLHISNLAAQTGASLFLHLHAPPYPDSSLVLAPVEEQSVEPWTYNKTEGIPLEDLAASPMFTHLIAESDHIAESSQARSIINTDWDIVARIHGFAGLGLNPKFKDFVLAVLTRRVNLDKNAVLQEIVQVVKGLPGSVITNRETERLVLLQRKHWAVANNYESL